MTVTTIDTKIALVLIDLQKGLVALPAFTQIGDVIQNARLLANAFRKHGQCVVLVTVDGAPRVKTDDKRFAIPSSDEWAFLIDGLDQRPHDIRITKQTPGAFTGTGLEAQLKNLGVTQIVIGGISTSMGVEMTGRQAYERSINCVFAIDAMTDSNPEAHSNSVTRIFPRIGETATTRQILDMLSTAT